MLGRLLDYQAVLQGEGMELPYPEPVAKEPLARPGPGGMTHAGRPPTERVKARARPPKRRTSERQAAPVPDATSTPAVGGSLPG